MPETATKTGDTLAYASTDRGANPPRAGRFDRRSIVNFLVLIVVTAGGLYLLANERVSLWDRDEPRYAQTSRQMLQTHQWVVPMLLDEVRNAKPIFIYWCQAASMWMLRDKVNLPPTPTTVFAVRLPSAVAMILVLILLAVVLYRYAGAKRALWTLVVFSTSLLVILAAKMCLTDAVLLLWTTIALLCLYAIYRGNRAWWLTIVFWGATGLGALTKGPVELAVILMAMIALAAMDFELHRASAAKRKLTRELADYLSLKCSGAAWAWYVGYALGLIAEFVVMIFRLIAEFVVMIFQGSWRAARQWWWKLRPIVGILILAAICAPWMVLVSRRDPGFITKALMNEVLGRATHAMQQHKGPPGYYLATIFAFFFPWSLLLPTALILGFRRIRRPQTRFALACIIGPWIMLEFVATKLPHYLLPAYVPLAFLTAEAILVLSRRMGQYAKRSPIPLVGVIFWCAAVLGICALPWALVIGLHETVPKSGSIALMGMTLIGVLWMAVVFFRFYRRNMAGAAVAMGTGMVLFIALLYAGFIPNAPFLNLPREVSNVLVSADATMPGQEAMIGYKELSTVFYQGGTMRPLRDDDFLEKTPYRQWPQWIVISNDVWRKTSPQVKSLLRRVAQFQGLNYAGGMKKVEVWVMHK